LLAHTAFQSNRSQGAQITGGKLPKYETETNTKNEKVRKKSDNVGSRKKTSTVSSDTQKQTQHSLKQDQHAMKTAFRNKSLGK
jgi:hypothetical protein